LLTLLGPRLYRECAGAAGVLLASGAMPVRPEPYPLEDTTIACTFPMLAVRALGLGSVWIGAFDPKKIAASMNVPDGQIPVAILALV
jgi:nitroreductase